MALKRKRSDSEISTSSSIFSSPPQAHAMEISNTSPFTSQTMGDIARAHLSGRTRKRFRDNRPSDAKIHEHTLSMLYSAQKNLLQPSAPIQTSPAASMMETSTQQTSLHSFWSLPPRPSSCSSSNASTSSPPPATTYRATHCEDCNAGLVSADGDVMDVDMDVDMHEGPADYACSTCGKQVCHRCAISNLGAERRCLICAGKRTWVGGIGWMDQD